MDERQCRKCYRWLPLDSDHFCSVTRNGKFYFTYQCKDCRALYRSIQYEKRKRKKEFKQANAAYMREWRAKNKDSHNEYLRQWRLKKMWG